MAQIVGSVVVLVGITAAAWAWRRTRPYLIVGWLWYLVMLLPVIGLVQVGVQAMADRYTYLPQIGVVVTLVWAVAGVPRAARRPPSSGLRLRGVAGGTDGGGLPADGLVAQQRIALAAHAGSHGG